MSKEPHRPGDQYSRVEYRRLIAWERRMERESPFLLRLLEEAPERSVVDLGCGTGEHVAFFAERGVRAVGVDRSESMIESAKAYEVEGKGRFVLGDAREADELLADEKPFGLALCLGNMLPHLPENDDLDRLVHALHAVLRPGGVFLLQILNYARILEKGLRHLPLNFREGEEDREIVFLRLMKPAGEGRIQFFPTTLELDPDAEEPVSVKSTRNVLLRAWTQSDLRRALEARDFEVRLHGDMAGGAFDPGISLDLVLVALRGSAGAQRRAEDAVG